ncbi:hypothetical protein P4O66_001135 [Electrophorus voltai]|uniref:Alkylated DNA repair protein AlkB homologue 8 N-terminal domain-containing protein n=1 Tax=Electrophorus voltai TaxID=2609070 RepID=A0AAD8ZAE2_9TELE|nr:hypothetical protein P4O66_001135 [Electrophorus voltai]
MPKQIYSKILPADILWTRPCILLSLQRNTDHQRRPRKKNKRKKQGKKAHNCSSPALTGKNSILLGMLCTDCTASSSSTIIVKFADGTVVMGLTSDNDEMAYLEEIKYLENWCQGNNLLLNISKTKELIVDCSKQQEQHYQTLRINETVVERVESFRYLGVHISQVLSWSHHTISLAKKARQRLYHLRRLRDFRLPSKTIYYKRCQTKTRRIVKDPIHPNDRLFSLLRSGKCFRSLKTNTERLKRSFFPQATRALNQFTVNPWSGY